MKYFILKTPGEIRLVTASDTIDGKLNLQMKGFRTTSGIPESWEKDEKMSVGFLERLLKHGYISITESEYAAYLKTSETLLSNEGKEPEGEDIEALPQFVYVTGDLDADNLILSGWLDIIVAGNATINNAVFGYFGEPGGRLQVKGNLTTRYLLNGFIYGIEVVGMTNGTCYSFDPIDSVKGFEAQKIKYSFTEEDEVAESPLATSVIPYDKDMKEYWFNFESACTMLRKGAAIFKSI